MLNTDITRAKNYPIADYLTQKGIFAAKTQGSRLFYHSPFRSEKTPSFVVNANNTFKDFGESEKPSSIIDLVCRLENCSFKVAVEKILSLDFSLYHSTAPKKENENLISITKLIGTIQNKGLIDYLKSRAIILDLAKPYIQEVYFRINDKTRTNGQDYFAIGFENQEKGFDLRSKFFKGKSQPNSFTYLSRGFDKIAVFEGFFDFLSALTFYQTQEPKTDILVLNSNTNLAKAMPILTGYKKINSFLDNDQNGKQSFTQIAQSKPEQVVNQSLEIYPNHKDFNAFLVKNC